MKLAIFDAVGNPGGGGLFVARLLPGLKRARPDWDITFFASPSFLRRESNRAALNAAGIRTEVLQCSRLVGAEPFGWTWFKTVAAGGQMHLRSVLRHLPPLLSGNFKAEVERRTRGFDAAYFPWPFLVDCPETTCAKIATFHDFNFKYFFGTKTFYEHQLEQLDREMPIWLRTSQPVVSTAYIASEAAKWYPGLPRPARVIHMAPMVEVTPVPEPEAARLVAELGIDGPYLVYPCHLCSHKNIQNLVLALHEVRRRGHRLSLVLTGVGTPICTGRAGPLGIERVPRSEADVIGVGYVGTRVINSLFQRALAVVCPSLYEAGNGPGMDGWVRGTPVLMSDIPPFLEHAEWMGVKAGLFNPTQPLSIADAIERRIREPEAALAEASISRAHILRHGWDTVAGSYAEVISAAAATGTP